MGLFGKKKKQEKEKLVDLNKINSSEDEQQVNDELIDFGETNSSDNEYDETLDEQQVDDLDMDISDEDMGDDVEDIQKENVNQQDDKKKKTKQAKDYTLYFIADKPIDGMIEYFRNFGINISRVFNNIHDARDVMLMQLQESKLVVIDSGTGKFTSMSARKELIDLLGISEDGNKTTVFYSDSIIRKEVEYSNEVEDKDIEWVPYKSTAAVLAYLLQTKGLDNYIVDDNYKDIVPVEKNINVRGFKVECPNSVDIGAVQINTSDIVTRQNGEDGNSTMLQEYTVEI